jgi:hypothetical protein
MLYLSAFIVGGLLCALFEVFMIFTKLEPPKILILGLALGGFLVPAGMNIVLATLGGVGGDIMVSGAGSAVTASTLALLSGNPIPFLIVVGVFVALTVLGVAFGLLSSLTKKGGNP